MNLSPSKSTRSLNISHISPYIKQHTNTYTFECQSQQAEQIFNRNYEGNRNQERRNENVEKGQHRDRDHGYIFGKQRDRDDDTDFTEERLHIEKEYKMRMDSIVKGYEMKISRQHETFQLKQMKYMQQIEYLKRQIKQLTNITHSARPQNPDQHCSLCSNGQVLKFMKNMLEAVETDHKECVHEKSAYSTKILGLQQKLIIIETELQESEKRYTKLRQQNKQLKVEKEGWEREKREKQRQFREVERQYQVKQISYEQQYAKQRLMQKQLEGEIKKMQLQHIEAVGVMRQQSKQELEKQIKKIQGKFGESRRQSRDARDTQRQSLAKDQKRPSNRFQYQYDEQQEGHYPQQPQINSYQRNQQILSRPSLVSLSIQNPIITPASSHGSIRGNASTYWKQKYDESYADYANNKRKGRKIESRSGFYESKQNFDTFRPGASYFLSNK